MKKTTYKFYGLLIALTLTSYASVFAQYETVYSGSPSYETVYSGSPSYETVYSGSPSYSYTPGYSYTSQAYPVEGYANSGYSSYGYPSYGSTGGFGITYIGSGYGTNYGYNYATNYGYSGYNNVTVPTVTTTLCSDGQAPSSTTGCNRTTTLPVTTTTLCSDGRTPVNGSCTYTNIISGNNYTYQTCWDGSIIPTNSICSSQFKVCANGTSIPVNQTCYVSSAPVYVTPTVVKFNNVVTSVATQITQTSGRCNGIGLVANNTQSTGWFEYGETTSLGRTTATASIGSSNTAPFSNVLANLKPATRYYCRAVMQNQYGLVKGEIVGFTTTSKVTTYIKSVVITKKPVVKNITKKNEVLCSDGTTATIKSKSSASLINEGQKLITLSIEKTNGRIASGETVTYKINFKNLSDTRLTGILIKVILPQEIKLMSANIDSYDEVTRTLTLNQEGIDPYTEGSISLTGTIVKDAPLGKTIVTNVYALYTVPGTQIQDEVTAYVIGSIVPQTELTKEDTGVKNVVGASNVKGFMPNSLIEWLALLAILFILFILGRSIYASYKEDNHAHHH